MREREYVWWGAKHCPMRSILDIWGVGTPSRKLHQGVRKPHCQPRHRADHRLDWLFSSPPIMFLWSFALLLSEVFHLRPSVIIVKLFFWDFLWFCLWNKASFMSIIITLMGGTYCRGDVSSRELCILTISHLSRLPLFLQSLSSET